MSLQDLEAEAKARKDFMDFLKWYCICFGIIALVWAFSCR